MRLAGRRALLKIQPGPRRDIAVRGLGVLLDLFAASARWPVPAASRVHADFKVAGDRLELLFEHRFDRGGQVAAILRRQLDLAPRQRILIGPAAGEEQGRAAGMAGFQLALGKARIVARPVVAVQHRGVAGVAEQDGCQLCRRRRRSCSTGTS